MRHAQNTYSNPRQRPTCNQFQLVSYHNDTIMSGAKQFFTIHQQLPHSILFSLSAAFLPFRYTSIFNSPFEYDVIQLNVRSGSRWACLFYVHEHDHLGFGMLSVETAVLNPRVVFIWLHNCGFSSNCDRKGQ